MGDVARVCGVLVFLDVIGVYVYCIGIRGVYPPSHPWSAFVLLLLSFAMVRRLRNRERSKGSTPSRLYAALVMIAAGLWTVSAIVGR